MRDDVMTWYKHGVYILKILQEEKKKKKNPTKLYLSIKERFWTTLPLEAEAEAEAAKIFPNIYIDKYVGFEFPY